MKKSKIIYIILAIATLAIILYFAFRHTENDGHNHDGHSHDETETLAEESVSNIKEVELNEAQFKAANIELGTFSLKNLSEVINANGYTKLPPQNQADVSVHTTGIVKSILIEEGQYVKKGQTIITIESPEFTKLQEAYLTSKSNLEFLKLEFERQKTLNDEEVNSKKVFQKTKADYEIEKARFSSLQKQLNVFNINASGQTTSVVSVVAPISGYVTEIYIKIGSNVEIGKPLLSIVDNSKLHVDLLVYEKDLYKVKEGQQVRFILTNQDNAEVKGKIFSVGKAFENDTKSIAVHADIINKEQRLISGMYVNALIDIGTNAVSALPIDAIVKADGKEFIFILEENIDESTKKEKTFHFQRIEVKTGTNQLGYVQASLLQKVDKNAKIALKGAYYIQSHLIKNEGGGGHSH
ncbi:RND transporter [Flavobacterium sp. 316]|uniref:Efflux RND transporter periplasmic adaptor subunit n=1 Tax=Flavobacterium sediminilitoris TaxID=2024526 RepID=A0ABY4HKB3_9FLAO|nr:MULTISPECIES: efflux RND transporter periplasmic adaptor subunit [Flavobacterium]KIX22647.1 RND transporter [Flavobacterium sp. 316]UOX32975.1 efflux RND transporter periplasmic adaptor subunit [Flavobacterium sediminilitoris]